MELTQARLKELFNYDPLTGLFMRLQCRRSDRIGEIAGCKSQKGYVVISVDNKTYYAHRLAWVYITGVWPADQIDHRDTDKANNRIANLREADDVSNQQNRRVAKKGTQSGLLGAYADGSKWSSRIKANGKSVYLGTFPSAVLAHQAYMDIKKQLHPIAFK